MKTFPNGGEWGVQNGSIKKNEVLQVTSLFFWKFYYSLRTFYKMFIWRTNYPNAHIRTFRKSWGFIWGCFFSVSILKVTGLPSRIYTFPKKSLHKFFRECFQRDVFRVVPFKQIELYNLQAINILKTGKYLL